MSTRSHSTGGGSEIEPGMTAETNEDWCARDEDSGGSRDRSDASEDEDPFAAFQDSSTAIGFAVGSARESSPEEASASFMSGETDADASACSSDRGLHEQEASDAESDATSYSGDGSQGMSASMNLHEYEARFVHRTLPTSSQSVPTVMPRHSSRSPRENAQESVRHVGPTEIAASLDVLGHDDAGMDDMPPKGATLVDPHTGKTMTEEEWVAQIRAGIAAAQAQAQAHAVADMTGTESESLLGPVDGDESRYPESDMSQYADFGSPQQGRSATAQLDDADEHICTTYVEERSTTLLYDDPAEPASQDPTPERIADAGERFDSDLLNLVIEGTDLMSTLPSPHYRRVSSQLLESSSPVATALRKAGADACNSGRIQDNVETASDPAEGHSSSSPPSGDKSAGVGSLASQHKFSDDSNISALPSAAQRHPNIKGHASAVNDVRQFRSLQTRRHISDILVRIRNMQEHMKSALLDDSMSISTHSRVFQKFDVIAGIIHTLGRQLRASKSMPLVLRDKHDESMRVASVECLSIVKEAGIEAYTILKQLHDSIVETQVWLCNIEDEVVRIAEGTVLLGTADASELQPVFEQLYYRWQTEKGPVGHTFNSWKSICMRKREIQQRNTIEAVVKRLSEQRTMCIKDMWMRWVTRSLRKKRDVKIQVSRRVINMFSSKLWTLGLWKKVTIRHRRSRHMRQKLMRGMHTRSFEAWSHRPVIRKLAGTRRQRVELQYKKKICGAVSQAWHRHILRENKIRIKLKTSNDLHRVQTQARVMNGWNFLKSKHKYQRQEIEKRARERDERVLQEWRIVARRLKTLRRRSGFLNGRVNFRLRDEVFQLWCESIEAKIIKKIKVDKMRSQSRIFWLTGTYRRWADASYVTQSGVGNFKVRRTFKSLKRYVRILTEQRRISQKWNDTNMAIALKAMVERWQGYVYRLREGMHKLRGICEEQGGLDEKMCIDKWRAKESKSRLWRYQRRHLQKRQNTFLKTAFWKLWLLNGLGKEQFDKQSLHAIRMGHRRRRSHIAAKCFRVLTAYLTYMLAKRRKVRQVVTCGNRRKVHLAWSIWYRMVIASRALAVVHARHLTRFKRRFLKLFARNIKQRVSRILFGAWCGECKRPFGKNELQDYAQNPAEVDLRLNERERRLVAAKRQRHLIRNLLQNVSVESGSSMSTQTRDLEDRSVPAKSSTTTARRCLSSREAQLVDEYLREVDEAKLMLAQQDGLHVRSGSHPGRFQAPQDELVDHPKVCSREQRKLQSAWAELRKELTDTHQDITAASREDLISESVPYAFPPTENSEAASDPSYCSTNEPEIPTSLIGQHRDSAESQAMAMFDAGDDENLAPYNPSQLRNQVLEALELAGDELSPPNLYDAARPRATRHANQLPILQQNHGNAVGSGSNASRGGLEHHVVADKKTYATHAYHLRHAHHHPHAQFVKNWSRQLRNDKALSAVADSKEPHPPSVAKPSHLVGAGLGFNPQYRVKRREIDPRLLEKSPYSSSIQLLPDAEKSTAIRNVQQKIVSAEPDPYENYSVDEMAEYLSVVGARVGEEQVLRLKRALLRQHVP